MSSASRPVLASLACLLVLASAPPLAGAQPAETRSSASVRLGSATGTSSIKTDATIVRIDPAKRVITLKGRQGRVFDIAAGTEVRNFDQLRVGDRVTAEYTAAASIALKKGGKQPRQWSDKETVDRAAPGASPGGTVARTLTVLADVVAIDAKHQVVTLRGPEGHLLDITIADPAQLKNIKKGDQVEATYTESLAIAVEAAAVRK